MTRIVPREPFHYVGRTVDGYAVRFRSIRWTYTHAAVHADPARRDLARPAFACSAEAARKGFGVYAPCEVVELRKVTAEEYAALGRCSNRPAQAGRRVARA